jgi:hypothetical protein
MKFNFLSTFFGGWHPQPIHGQPDAVLSGHHLKKLRDTLLPKLMSGEVRVSV